MNHLLTNSVVCFLDQLPSVGLSSLIQVSCLITVAIMCLALFCKRRTTSYALCLTVIIGCAGVPFVGWQVAQNGISWCRMSVFPTEVQTQQDSGRPKLATPAPDNQPVIDSGSKPGSRKPFEADSNPAWESETQIFEERITNSDSPPTIVTELSPLSDTRLVTQASTAASADTNSTAVSTTPPNGLPFVTTTVPTSGFWWSVLRVGMGAWLLVALLLVMRFAVRVRRIRQVLRSTNPVTSAWVVDMADRLSNESELRKLPPIVSSDSVPAPFVFGLLSPRIAIPGFLTVAAHQEMLRHVLLHEFAHVRRRDLWFARLQHLVEIVFWVNPLVHLISRKASRLREEICDNHVLEFASATSYSKTLLALTERLEREPRTAVSMGVLNANWPLENRIGDLLSRDRIKETKTSGRKWAACVVAVIAVAIPLTGIVVSLGSVSQVPVTICERVLEEDAEEVLRQVLERAERWTGKRADSLKALCYTHTLQNKSNSIEVVRGVSLDQESYWCGTTLHSGLQILASHSDLFDVTFAKTDGKTSEKHNTRLICKLRNPNKPLTMVIGNGVANGWYGYFSKPVIQITLDIDPVRMVPFQEQVDNVTVVYNNWLDADAGQMVPGLVTVHKESITWNMKFAWAGDSVWIFRNAETTVDKIKTVVALTSNIKVNDESVIRELTEKDASKRKMIEAVQEMLSQNQGWLKPGISGLDSIEYIYHVVGEDVKETCHVSKDGTVVFENRNDIDTADIENQHDIGTCKIVLPNGHWATIERDQKYTTIQHPDDAPRSYPYGQQLQHYARIGCQIDMPMFRLDQTVKHARIQKSASVWQGTACDVYQIQGFGRDDRLAFGTMLPFVSSTSSANDIRPVSDTIYIDQVRQIPLHETIRGTDRTWEVDYKDWQQVGKEKQWVPKTIRIEAEDYLACEYSFQIVAGRHWILSELVSWSDPANKSHARVIDVRLNKSSTLYEKAIRRLDSTQQLFSDVDKRDREQINMNSIPLPFGRWIESGDIRTMLTLKDTETLQLRIDSEHKPAEPTVAFILLDAKGRPLYSETITLSEQGSRWTGVADLGALTDASQIAGVSFENQDEGQSLELEAIPISIGSSHSINIPDPDQGKTRVAGIMVDRKNGKLTAILKVVSTDGPYGFPMTISVALLDGFGQLIAGESHTDSFVVKFEPAEGTFEIELGELSEKPEPEFAIVSVFTGRPTSGHVGSLWAVFMGRRDVQIPVKDLFLAEDIHCHAIAAERLTAQLADRTIEKEFLDSIRDHDQLVENKTTCSDILQPFVDDFESILSSDRYTPELLQSTARLLGYSGDKTRAAVLLPMLSSDLALTQTTTAIALAMLGDDKGLDRVKQTVMQYDFGMDFSRVEYRRLLDSLVALLLLDSREAYDVLGSTMVGDIKFASDESNDARLIQGRKSRAEQIASLLQFAKPQSGPVAARWSIEAVEFLDSRPDASQYIDQSALVNVMLQNVTESRATIEKKIGQADHQMLYQLKHNPIAVFMPSVGELLLRPDVPAATFRYGVSYFWNLNQDESKKWLAEIYQRNRPDDVRARMVLCQALAYFGDGRGMLDALDVLTNSYLPLDDAELRDDAAIKRAREKRSDQRDYAISVVRRASTEMILSTVETNSKTDDPHQQQAIIAMMEWIEVIPPAFLDAIGQWLPSNTPSVDNQVRRFLEKHGRITPDR